MVAAVAPRRAGTRTVITAHLPLVGRVEPADGNPTERADAPGFLLTRDNGSVSETPQSLYDAIGGSAFRDLVHRFYAGVADDPVLRPLYPDDDLTEARERLRLFLVQYWGGP